MVLAAGHRHRVVEENLVGHVDLGGGRGADGEQARVVVGAVAEVREDVLLAGERRLADPGRALRSEEHTSELQSRRDLVCRLLLEKKKKKHNINTEQYKQNHSHRDRTV